MAEKTPVSRRCRLAISLLALALVLADQAIQGIEQLARRQGEDPGEDRGCPDRAGPHPAWMPASGSGAMYSRTMASTGRCPEKYSGARMRRGWIAGQVQRGIAVEQAAVGVLQLTAMLASICRARWHVPDRWCRRLQARGEQRRAL